MANFAGSPDYAADAVLANFAIARATPTLTVADAGGTFNGNAFPATGSVAGIDGSFASSLEGVTPSLIYYGGTYTSSTQLAGIDPLGTAPSNAGAFTIEVRFPGSTDYSTASDLANFTIAPATPTVAIADASGTYTGTPFSATATVAGVNGSAASSLEGVTPSTVYFGGTYTTLTQLNGLTPLSDAPIDAGPYTVVANFPFSTDYVAASALANFTIAPATSTVSVSNTVSVYTGTPFSAMATVAGVNGSAASNLEGVNLSLSYYSGTYATTAQLNGLTPLPTGPTQTGNYTVLAGFPGSTDYTSSLGLANFTITPAAPTLTVNDPGGTYNGNAFTATATVAGIDGTAGPTLEGISPSLAYYSGTYTTTEQLSSLTPLSTAPDNAGAYTVRVRFTGSTDYTIGSMLGHFTIAQATPQVTWSPPMSIVFGTPLSATQLDAITSVPGTFTYTPAQGAILAAKNGQDLSVTFTPQDTTDYTTAVTTTTINIERATPTLNLSDPGGRFDGSAFPASLTIAGSGTEDAPAASLENITPTLTYYNGAGTSLGSSPPRPPGPTPSSPSSRATPITRPSSSRPRSRSHRATRRSR